MVKSKYFVIRYYDLKVLKSIIYDSFDDFMDIAHAKMIAAAGDILLKTSENFVLYMTVNVYVYCIVVQVRAFFLYLCLFLFSVSLHYLNDL